MFSIFSSITFAGEVLVLSGLLEEDIQLTVTELKALQKVTKDLVSVNSAGRESHFTVGGALLRDVLSLYQIKQENVLGIRLVAGDGYAIDVTAEIVKERDIILAYEIDGQPLDERTKPLRAIVPEERSMYWVRNLVRIEILGYEKTQEVTKVFFLEPLSSLYTVEDYPYYDDVDKAIFIGGLMEYLALETPERVQMTASDSFEKNETAEIFLSGYLKITGRYAPLFASPDLPRGMHVKDIVFFTYGTNVFVSMTQALHLYGTTIVEDREGLSLASLVPNVGLKEGGSYLLTASDGYTVEIAAEDFVKGIAFFDDANLLRTFFPGLPRNTQLKGLYTIEVQ